MTVKLDLPKTSSGLAGFKYGQEVFESQVDKNYSIRDEGLKIIFPDYIERIASSFVQGFFSKLVEDYGYDEVHDKVVIQAKNDELREKIWERLY